MRFLLEGELTSPPEGISQKKIALPHEEFEAVNEAEAERSAERRADELFLHYKAIFVKFRMGIRVKRGGTNGPIIACFARTEE